MGDRRAALQVGARRSLREGLCCCMRGTGVRAEPGRDIVTAKFLTARAVEVAKPKRNTTGKLVRNEIPDGGCPGLYLVVEPTGTKSWAHRYRHRGRSKKDTLERGLSLAAARHVVAAARHRLGQGMDPASAPPVPARPLPPMTALRRRWPRIWSSTPIVGPASARRRRPNMRSTGLCCRRGAAGRWPASPAAM